MSERERNAEKHVKFRDQESIFEVETLVSEKAGPVGWETKDCNTWGALAEGSEQWGANGGEKWG